MTLLILTQILPQIVVFVILYSVIFIYRQYNLRKNTKSPFTEDNLIRLPGHSLNEKIKKFDRKIDESIFMIIVIALISTNAFVSTSVMKKGKVSFEIDFIIIIIFIIISISFFIVRIIKKLAVRNKFSLGYFGEITTAQYLQKLAPNDHFIYHDFPANNFNIDHIVIGKTGVYAIETKTRSKITSKNDKNHSKAEYNGKELFFSNSRETKYLEQTKRQAAWLSNWLKSSTGETVPVIPVLSLPGFFVLTKVKNPGIYVVNPKRIYEIFKSSRIELDDKKIKQIVHQVEEKCRDVEITSKKFDSKKM